MVTDRTGRRAGPMVRGVNFKLRFALLAFILMLTANMAYCGYCPRHSKLFYKKGEIDKFIKDKMTDKIIKELIKNDDFLRACDKAYKAANSRWGKDEWVSHKISTAVGSAINKIGTAKEAYENVKEIADGITMMILAGMDGFAEDYEKNLGDKSTVGEFGYELVYGIVALVVNDSSIWDEFLKGFDLNYEDKSFLSKLGVDGMYHFIAWIKGSKEILECTHSSPHCPREGFVNIPAPKPAPKKEDNNNQDPKKEENGSYDNQLPVETPGGNGNGGKSVLTPLKPIRVYR